MIRRSGAPSSSRRVIRSAAKTVSASFINSDGWSRNWPKPTHRLEPCTCTPSPGTRTTSRSRKVMPRRSGLSRRSLRWSKRTASVERDDADRHPHALADEDGPRTSVERDGDHRRSGTDHHQPDHAEQAQPQRGGPSRWGARPPWHAVPTGAGPSASPHEPPQARTLVERTLAERTLARGSRFGADRAVAAAGGVTAVTPRPPAREERSDTRLMGPVSPMKRPKWWNVVM